MSHASQVLPNFFLKQRQEQMTDPACLPMGGGIESEIDSMRRLDPSETN